MKKSLHFCLILLTALLLTGCQDKFEPTESTIYITSKGAVRSALMESFDKEYYQLDELSEDVEKEVKAYCLDVNEEAVTVESLTMEGDEVRLFMNYQTVEDYAAFNKVLLFAGTVQEAIENGYELNDPLQADGDTAGNAVELDLEKDGDLKVIITEENLCVQTSGRIRYVSDNVTLVEKKLARTLEASENHPAFIIYK